ncbi:unnamed protein product [Lepeophtheirus salmonis]|uniref:(salmon louse) hypothetical protein n=1 Tax=Lepeophtheirus salmonis TaxID=72036 RepID=A0A7R8CW79_LEPSM|nr:unnamed protein product [Lepeophtheirus salmonis]CAF2949650.1 unnamed protein product [Lepeophtheirus salmonis]
MDLNVEHEVKYEEEENIYESKKLLIRQMQGMIAKEVKKTIDSEYDSWSDLEENFAKVYEPIPLNICMETWEKMSKKDILKEVNSPNIRREFEDLPKNEILYKIEKMHKSAAYLSQKFGVHHLIKSEEVQPSYPKLRNEVPKRRIHDSWSSRASSILKNPESIYVSREEVIKKLSNNTLTENKHEVSCGSWSSHASSVLTNLSREPVYMSRVELIRKLDPNHNEVMVGSKNFEESSDNSFTETESDVSTVRNATIDFVKNENCKSDSHCCESCHQLESEDETSTSLDSECDYSEEETSCSCSSCVSYSDCSCCMSMIDHENNSIEEEVELKKEIGSSDPKVSLKNLKISLEEFQTEEEDSTNLTHDVKESHDSPPIPIKGVSKVKQMQLLMEKKISLEIDPSISIPKSISQDKSSSASSYIKMLQKNPSRPPPPKELTDYDTFGSIDSLIFEPKTPSHDDIVEVLEESEIGIQVDDKEEELEELNKDDIGPGKTTFAERVKLFQNLGNSKKEGSSKKSSFHIQTKKLNYLSNLNSKTSSTIPSVSATATQTSLIVNENDINSSSNTYNNISNSGHETSWKEVAAVKSSVSNSDLFAETLLDKSTVTFCDPVTKVIPSEQSYSGPKSKEEENGTFNIFCPHCQMDVSLCTQCTLEQPPSHILSSATTSWNYVNSLKVTDAATTIKDSFGLATHLPPPAPPLPKDNRLAIDYSKKMDLVDNSRTNNDSNISLFPVLIRDGETVTLTEEMFRGESIKKLESEMGDSGIMSPPSSRQVFEDSSLPSPEGEGVETKAQEEEEEEEIGLIESKKYSMKPQDTMIRELKSKLKEKFEVLPNEKKLDINIGTVELGRQTLGPKLSKIFGDRNFSLKEGKAPLVKNSSTSIVRKQSITSIIKPFVHQTQSEVILNTPINIEVKDNEYSESVEATPLFISQSQEENEKKLHIPVVRTQSVRVMMPRDPNMDCDSSIYDPSLPEELCKSVHSGVMFHGNRPFTPPLIERSSQFSFAPSLGISNKISEEIKELSLTNNEDREVLYGPGGVYGPHGPFSTPEVRYPNGGKNIKSGSNFTEKKLRFVRILESHEEKEEDSSRAENYENNSRNEPC